ncbi:MAG: hypothetical protein ABSB42_01255 [Tepidisphaeraceae bacterium]|jgi:hypothetical protein
MKEKKRLPIVEFLRTELTKIVEAEPWEPRCGKYRSPMFPLALALRRRDPDFTGDGEDAWPRVNRFVTEKLGGWRQWKIWVFVRQDDDGRGELELMDVDSIHVDFVNSFDKCRPASLDAPLKAAAKLAVAHQPFFKPDRDHGYDDYPKFLSMCAFLPKVTGRGTVEGISGFFLSQRHAAAALGVNDPKKIGRWIKLAEKDGHLILTKKYPRGVRKAWEYRVGPQLEAWADR